MQINNYEKAGIIFSQERNALMSYNLFLDALLIEPNNAMIWHELGDSLLAFAIQTKSENVINKALFCLLKSVELDKNNLTFKKVIEDLKSNAHIGLEKLNSVGEYKLEDLKILQQNILNEHLIAFFQSFKNLDNKISLIIFLGETGDNKYFDLLKHCILNEENQHIKFAALKRIHLFKDQNDLKFIFSKIIEEKKRQILEPYFTMSLTNINEDWCKELIKNSKIDFELVDQTLDYTSDNTEEINPNDEAKAIIMLSLSKYNLNELKNFYEFRNNKVIVESITYNMSKLGIYKLFELKIVNQNDKNLTDYGWELIKNFIDKQIEIKNKEAESETKKTKLKWWQF